MKKFLPLIILSAFIFTACPGVYMPKNAHSIARIKEKYACNIELANKSSYNLQYRYAIVPQRNDIEELPIWIKHNETKSKIGNAGEYSCWPFPNGFNIFGKVLADSSKVLYSGIDCGAYIYSIARTTYPNINVDGLPSRFVLMVDGDNRIYELVYDCEKKNETSRVVITDETIKRLQNFKDDEFECGYNGKRDYYGESVEIQDRLYCFGRIATKKDSLKDYSAIEGQDLNLVLYGRVNLSYFFDYVKNPDVQKNNLVLLLYDDDQDKFYYVKDDASVNPVD